MSDGFSYSFPLPPARSIIEEAASLAQNLARNCDYPVFPCGDDKRPTLKRWPERAAKNPDRIAWLWRQWPGSLIGIVTGEPSGISVLDVDEKREAARLWWRAHHARLLPTSAYRTRSGGLHLFYRHVEGIKNSQGKLAAGIDTRGSGGYVISWFAAGFECLDHTPPAPWPAWLRAELLRSPSPPPPSRHAPGRSSDDVVNALVRRVAEAREGDRNGLLFWAACRCFERGMRQAEIEGLLIPAAHATGLPSIEARRTIASAKGRASMG